MGQCIRCLGLWAFGVKCSLNFLTCSCVLICKMGALCSLLPHCVTAQSS